MESEEELVGVLLMLLGFVMEWRVLAIVVTETEGGEKWSVFACSGVHLRDNLIRGAGERADGSLWRWDVELVPVLPPLLIGLDDVVVVVVLLLVAGNAIFMLDSIFVVVLKVSEKEDRSLFGLDIQREILQSSSERPRPAQFL